MPDNIEAVATLEKQIADLEKQIEALGSDVQPKAEVAKSEDKPAPAKLSKEAAQDDDEPVVAKDAPKQDEPVAAEPVAKEAEVAKQDVTVAKAADETIEYAGQTIRKSEVGEGSFAIIQKQMADQAALRKDLDAEIERRTTAEFEKRAQESYGHLPGSVEERGAMLKHLNTMPEAVRKSVEAVLNAHEAMSKAAFDKVGVNPGDLEKMKKSSKSFEAKVDEIARTQKIAKHEAMSLARKDDPEGFQAYQDNAQVN